MPARESTLDQSSLVAPSSHGCCTPRACSVPAISPVVMSEGAPSPGAIQGAHGQPAMDGSANTAPPPGGAWAASHSHAPSASPVSQASVSCRTLSANAMASGWLPGQRESGSSAWPNPPSALR